jgi:hypothetical protein
MSTPLAVTVAACIAVTLAFAVAASLLLGQCTLAGVEALVPTAQRASLVDLYSATGGTGWTASVRSTWLNGDPCTPSSWVGLSCGVDVNGTTVVR